MLISALLLGLISSLHCIGMCGPIVMVLPIHTNNHTTRVLQLCTYHLGRLLSYSLMGLVFGLLGKGFFLAGLQQQLSILVGIMMIVYVLVPVQKLGKLGFLKPVFRLVQYLKMKLGAQFKKKSYRSLFTIGFFNGFLPCAMVYVALFGALAMQNLWLGGLYMFVYGLGTIPLLSTILIARDLFTPKLRNAILKYYPILIVLFGMLFIVRGLGLDISFLSPKTMSLFVQENPVC
ncbi:sulfite exporter TauE/SafE family protein [Myroides sp. LJL116]